MTVQKLFSSFQLNGLTLPNRLVMAPMTRRFATDGIIPEAAIAYYERRARGGVGLILTEVCTIDRPSASCDLAMPYMWGPALDRWREVVEAVHNAGGLIGAQIAHTGASRHMVTGEVLDATDSPSGFESDGRPLREPMTEEEIADTIVAFADAAADAKAIGFDAVEIHGAHGCLIDQFAWSFTNRRTDRWGGDMRNRARFGAEVIRAIRQRVGPDYPIIIRLSQWKLTDYAAKVVLTPDDMGEWLAPLVEAGVDAIHGSQRRFWEPEFEGSDLNFAGWAKKLTGIATITVGSVGLNGEFLASYAGESAEPTSIEGLSDRLEAGEFDLVAVGRALLGDAQWVQKIEQGRIEELRTFNPEALTTLV